jgi:hypothetical protein
MKRKPMTASELMAQLNADPEYVARKKRLDEAHQRTADELARAEEPLVEALRAAGAPISTIWDLVNFKGRYPKLMPILMEHLDRAYPLRIREGIARALATRDARPYWDQLVSRFLASTDTQPNGLKWALHMAISAAADASVLDELIKLAIDKRHGHNRALFVDALVRIRDPRALAALDELESDPDLADDFRRIRKKRGK